MLCQKKETKHCLSEEETSYHGNYIPVKVEVKNVSQTAVFTDAKENYRQQNLNSCYNFFFLTVKYQEQKQKSFK
jgi:hypothetical protein